MSCEGDGEGVLEEVQRASGDDDLGRSQDVVQEIPEVELSSSEAEASGDESVSDASSDASASDQSASSEGTEESSELTEDEGDVPQAKWTAALFRRRKHRPHSAPKTPSAESHCHGMGEKPTEKLCRVCFEGGGGLVAPCDCKGTQKWIHKRCLKKWRLSVLEESSPRAGRAHICNVCNARFTVAPPKMPPGARIRRILADWGAQIMTVLYVLMASHSAVGWLWLLIISFVAWRYPGLAFGTALVLFGMGQRMGIRPAVTTDARGQMQMVLIHHGEPVPGIQGGIFLVSLTESGSLFDRSVIYLTRHDASGSVGFIVNKPDPTHENTTDAVIALYGGPVRGEMYTIHSVSDAGGAEVAFRDDEGEPLYSGGSVVDVIRRATVEKPALVFDGCSQWGAGQLDGEVRAKVWGYVPAWRSVFTEDDRSQIWQEVRGHPNLAVFGT